MTNYACALLHTILSAMRTSGGNIVQGLGEAATPAGPAMTDIPADGTSAFATASSEGAQEQPWHRVADSNALDVAPGGSRLHVCVEGRYVSIIRHGGGVYCLDSNCHHAGGPLALGEIEEVDSHPCLVCPWVSTASQALPRHSLSRLACAACLHRRCTPVLVPHPLPLRLVLLQHYYRVSLDGEKFYQSADADAEGKLHAGEWRSVGPRQRVSAPVFFRICTPILPTRAQHSSGVSYCPCTVKPQLHNTAIYV